MHAWIATVVLLLRSQISQADDTFLDIGRWTTFSTDLRPPLITRMGAAVTLGDVTAIVGGAGLYRDYVRRQCST